MKLKLLFILFLFSCYIGCAQNSSIQMYSTDTTLSEYVTAHFNSYKKNDTCYSGIHFIKIKFSTKRSLVISISGELSNQYSERIKQLIGTFALSHFNSEFINYCRRNKKMIIQPILFDISSNCISHDSTLDFKNSEKILKDTSGREILILVSHYLIMQKFSIINSFKEIGGDQYTNCIILGSCIIESKKIKNAPKA